MFGRNRNSQKPDTEMENENEKENKKKTFSPDELDDFAVEIDADEQGADDSSVEEPDAENLDAEELDTEEVAAAESAATTKLFMEKIKKLEAEVVQEHERTLRFAAELDNLRRRSAREQADLLRYSGLEVIRAILPVMDNLQRAIAAAEQQNADDPLLEGVRMVYQQLSAALEKNNCQKIHAEHEPFDPKFHEAISQMPSDEFPENTVLIVTQDGYMLADRVIRPSQVIVSKKA